MQELASSAAQLSKGPETCPVEGLDCCRRSRVGRLASRADAKLERDRTRESERAWRSQREELQQRLEAAKLEHAAALLKQREDAAGHQRALQVRSEEPHYLAVSKPSRCHMSSCVLRCCTEKLFA